MYNILIGAAGQGIETTVTMLEKLLKNPATLYIQSEIICLVFVVDITLH